MEDQWVEGNREARQNIGERDRNDQGEDRDDEAIRVSS